MSRLWSKNFLPEIHIFLTQTPMMTVQDLNKWLRQRKRFQDSVLYKSILTEDRLQKEVTKLWKEEQATQKLTAWLSTAGCEAYFTDKNKLMSEKALGKSKVNSVRKALGCGRGVAKWTQLNRIVNAGWALKTQPPADTTTAAASSEKVTAGAASAPLPVPVPAPAGCQHCGALGCNVSHVLPATRKCSACHLSLFRRKNGGWDLVARQKRSNSWVLQVVESAGAKSKAGQQPTRCQWGTSSVTCTACLAKRRSRKESSRKRKRQKVQSLRYDMNEGPPQRHNTTMQQVDSAIAVEHFHHCKWREVQGEGLTEETEESELLRRHQAFLASSSNYGWVSLSLFRGDFQRADVSVRRMQQRRAKKRAKLAEAEAAEKTTRGDSGEGGEDEAVPSSPLAALQAAAALRSPSPRSKKQNTSSSQRSGSNVVSLLEEKDEGEEGCEITSVKRGPTEEELAFTSHENLRLQAFEEHI